MRIMDYREAKACLDEYRILLDGTRGMLRSDAVESEFVDKIRELNDHVIATLGVLKKEALILSIQIWTEVTEREDQVLDFPDEYAELLVALNELKLATDRAAETQAEHLRKTAASKAKEEATKGPSPTDIGIEKFRREHGMMKRQEREEYDRNAGLKEFPSN